MKSEYRHGIDAKGRMFVPVKLREELGMTFVVTKGLDGCLFVYSNDSWKELEEKINNLPLSKARDMQRFFISAACDVTTDSQGRILIPQNLRTFANLEKDVVVAGIIGRAEIWNASKWDEYNNNISEEKILECMEDIGF